MTAVSCGYPICVAGQTGTPPQKSSTAWTGGSPRDVSACGKVRPVKLDLTAQGLAPSTYCVVPQCVYTYGSLVFTPVIRSVAGAVLHEVTANSAEGPFPLGAGRFHRFFARRSASLSAALIVLYGSLMSGVGSLGLPDVRPYWVRCSLLLRVGLDGQVTNR